MASTIGTFVPLHSSGVGKAYLSALPEDEFETRLNTLNLAPVTRFTTTDPETLTRQINESRKTGYIFDSQENEEGIACFGAAIVDQNNIPQAAISGTVPLFRLHDDKAQYVPHLLQCIRTITEHLRASGL